MQRRRPKRAEGPTARTETRGSSNAPESPHPRSVRLRGLDGHTADGALVLLGEPPVDARPVEAVPAPERAQSRPGLEVDQADRAAPLPARAAGRGRGAALVGVDPGAGFARPRGRPSGPLADDVAHARLQLLQLLVGEALDVAREERGLHPAALDPAAVLAPQDGEGRGRRKAQRRQGAPSEHLAQEHPPWDGLQQRVVLGRLAAGRQQTVHRPKDRRERRLGLECLLEDGPVRKTDPERGGGRLPHGLGHSWLGSHRRGRLGSHRRCRDRLAARADVLEALPVRPRLREDALALPLPLAASTLQALGAAPLFLGTDTRGPRRRLRVQPRPRHCGWSRPQRPRSTANDAGGGAGVVLQCAGRARPGRRLPSPLDQPLQPGDLLLDCPWVVPRDVQAQDGLALLLRGHVTKRAEQVQGPGQRPEDALLQGGVAKAQAPVPGVHLPGPEVFQQPEEIRGSFGKGLEGAGRQGDAVRRLLEVDELRHAHAAPPPTAPTGPH
mmetsp:Transcript_100235/g.299210  ORF Transcript_100235/g.299210 Transcript_100235/m.299210 type:complete len:498 (-) Transcript_100235:42-1535(-)